ncbi:ABC-F family ATP-binding cassette domain-containing protein [Cellulosilyticum sp. I15G10I2]|uniref:ABC-F family ATP-binding cassette domain-containing protein n=1 Tax=Cellulosilyticum sp. I15G10I2 TaxID=1892843 RepID=UPI00085C7007|nr:ABC-F family ATP-binding cassette domain-containing protein [Cellulosilyticum sp. I15G10I2]
MILLSANHIKKVYGEKVLFEDLSISIDDSEKIGIIGINGTGKSSLLKILAGKESADHGEVITSNELVIEYLPQNPIFDEKSTVIEQIFKGESPFMKVLRDYESTVGEVELYPNNHELQQKLIKLSAQMDAVEAWQLESEAKAILMKLGITEVNQNVIELSGGQRKKIALAGALIRPCNLLILDEPTNHLDNNTIDYLEELIKAKKCAVVMVTHDRYFLDRIANRIIELDQGTLYKYEGNYETFVALKAQREEIEERMKEKDLSSYKKELEWMRKGVEARRTKQKARQDRFYELEKSLEGNSRQNLDIALGTSRLGKKIIHLDEITKSFKDHLIIEDFTYTVLKEDRIGIIGDNGAGKSTLLNLITGKIACDKGVLEVGETVKIGYYTQENKEMDLSIKVIDYIKDKAEYIKLADGSTLSASKMLERFLFPSSMQYTTINKLSGGERRRLYLLGVIMQDINVLLLDEPTNDLDIYTLQVLEAYIDEFNGPVISVSHDRYFLDRVAEKIFVCEGNGKITSYPGNYSDYHLKRQEENKFKQDCLKEAKTFQNENRTTKPQMIPPKLKFTYNEKLEYEKIDEEIERLEAMLKKIEDEILENVTNFSKLQDLTSQKQEVEDQIAYKLNRWEYLNELAQRINDQ